jgi:hypothetical protein
MNVQLHIDRVLIDHPLDVDRAGLEAAISGAMIARLDHNVPIAANEASRRGPDIDLQSGPAANLIAHAVADTVLPGSPPMRSEPAPGEGL